ncbi:MAG: DUF58 domain-containing protein, partial [Pseudobdellovibrionaceae bacterium]|nr:DUF58 domain-containing protein [Pseudobdellovibrionaceae bacterium]
MLAPELLSRIRRLELKAGHLASDILLGEYKSAFKGRGWEFDEVREYQVGDEIRSIDWNVTARMGQPYVKLFREEREMTLMLMVDVSSSLFFGSSARAKHEMVAELAAVLAFLAIRRQDKVGLLVFSDHTELYIPPGKGRVHVWSIIRSILTHKAQGQRTDLDGALKSFMQLRKRRCLAFVLSDFQAQGYEKTLKQVARRHELVCVQIEDPAERALPSAGLVWYQDRESGERVLVDSSDPWIQKEWPRQRAQEQKLWQKEMERSGASVLAMS